MVCVPILCEWKGCFCPKLMSIPFKVGILRLGRVAGKSKYALIDEADIPIVQQYAVEARVEVDKNGQGATVYAYAFDCTKGRQHSQKLHEMLWEVRRGGVAWGWKVVHKNQVTMDNRQDNLLLVRERDNVPAPAMDLSPAANATASSSSLEASAGKNMENSVYWMTVLQIVNDPNEHRFPEHVCARYYDSDGRVFESGTEELYYECHYPPCSRMESELREFHICGRCQYVRYCGQQCQERDWPMHRHYCREKNPSSAFVVTTPIRREQAPDR
ncbi:zinc finger MYND domain-containing protein 19-like [Babylonia areolata]|uniref:zinc finger MYND domain-containing protein 19-like n=1 Tax=Babylonia areolata TaxID=304850 RepID=UPI003FCFFE47